MAKAKVTVPDLGTKLKVLDITQEYRTLKTTVVDPSTIEIKGPDDLNWARIRERCEKAGATFEAM